METESVISKLKESLEKNYGDFGRTQYIIERLEKKLSLPKSDHLYIKRILKLCEPVTIEPEPKEIPDIALSEDLINCYLCDVQIELDEKSVRKNDYWFHDRCFEKINVKKPRAELISEKTLSSDLIKCYLCESDIKLDEKSIRKNGFWFHDRCFEKIPIVKPQIPQKIEPQKEEPITKIRKQPVRIVERKATYPQMIFSGGLLATLVGTTYFFVGEAFSIMTALWGSGFYLLVYRSQIFPTKKKGSDIVKTGIPGFDSTLSAGLKKNSSIVVSGPPGSGKTTFGLQFLYSGIKEFDEPGVYISLSQSIDEMKNDCKSFGWDMDNLLEKEKILMIDLRPFKIKDEIIDKDDTLYRGEQIPFEHLTKFILNSIKKIKAKRIVIDSISMLGMQYSDKFYMRQGLQGMIQALENFGVTSLLISEFSENNEIPLEWFVTSGIIQLDNQIIDNKMRRTIKITKLRGVEHSEDVHPLELGNNGLYVYEN